MDFESAAVGVIVIDETVLATIVVYPVVSAAKTGDKAPPADRLSPDRLALLLPSLVIATV